MSKTICNFRFFFFLKAAQSLISMVFFFFGFRLSGYCPGHSELCTTSCCIACHSNFGGRVQTTESYPKQHLRMDLSTVAAASLLIFFWCQCFSGQSTSTKLPPTHTENASKNTRTPPPKKKKLFHIHTYIYIHTIAALAHPSAQFGFKVGLGEEDCNDVER